MQKLFLTLSLLTTCSLVFADGLSIRTTGLTDKAKVVCNGKTLPYELAPNQSVNNLPWWLVSSAFGFQKILNCQFFLENKTSDLLGSATLSINNNLTEAEATNVQYSDQYHVKITPSDNVFTKSLTVALSR